MIAALMVPVKRPKTEFWAIYGTIFALRPSSGDSAPTAGHRVAGADHSGHLRSQIKLVGTSQDPTQHLTKVTLKSRAWNR